MRWFTLFILLGLVACSGGKDPAPASSQKAAEDTSKPAPTPSAANVTIKPDFSIGSDPDGILLGANVRLVEHSGGNIYVLDPDNFRVLVLKNDGSLIKEFGNEGQGPGEFQKPQGIAEDAAGNIGVIDPTARAIHAFDLDGAFIDAKRLAVNTPQVLGGPWYFTNGNVAMHLVALDQNFQVTYNLSIYDAELQPLKEIYADPSAPLDWNRSAEPGFWVEFLTAQFEEVGRGFANASVVNDRLVFARGTSFDIKVFDPVGSETGAFTIDASPIPFTDNSRKELFGQVWESMQSDPMLSNNLPRPTFERAMESVSDEIEVAPRISGVTPAGKGFAIFYNYDYSKGSSKIGFFDMEGKSLGTTDFKGPIQYLTGTASHLYAVGLDASDNVIINRYNIQGL